MPGFFMLRYGCREGKPSVQLQALADIALAYGNGVIDVTTRQQCNSVT